MPAVIVCLPDVVGGVLVECIGGPLDGRWLFVPASDLTVHVGQFSDGRRTPWLGIQPGLPNYLGYYGGAPPVQGGTLSWHTIAEDA
jgi:hypothetical protein